MNPLSPIIREGVSTFRVSASLDARLATDDSYASFIRENLLSAGMYGPTNLYHGCAKKNVARVLRAGTDRYERDHKKDIVKDQVLFHMSRYGSDHPSAGIGKYILANLSAALFAADETSLELSICDTDNALFYALAEPDWKKTGILLVYDDASLIEFEPSFYYVPTSGGLKTALKAAFLWPPEQHT